MAAGVVLRGEGEVLFTEIHVKLENITLSSFECR